MYAKGDDPGSLGVGSDDQKKQSVNRIYKIPNTPSPLHKDPALVYNQITCHNP
eukprot:gnl/Chilomastix_caulleri/6675.p1 GENE.gnl/Chilomastix_caulleri/6675~~gnl/Chilomastix_caulleri/6675.p1  ORF type:complete len:53 (+),score=3.31 gnl/Chilomastix_caulleri/6675:176-334(+)